jgi:hypothetical protein
VVGVTVPIGGKSQSEAANRESQKDFIAAAEANRRRFWLRTLSGHDGATLPAIYHHGESKGDHGVWD